MASLISGITAGSAAPQKVLIEEVASSTDADADAASSKVLIEEVKESTEADDGETKSVAAAEASPAATSLPAKHDRYTFEFARAQPLESFLAQRENKELMQKWCVTLVVPLPRLPLPLRSSFVCLLCVSHQPLCILAVVGPWRHPFVTNQWRLTSCDFVLP